MKRFGIALAISNEGLSADAVASRARVSGSYIRHIVRGVRNAPSPSSWRQAAAMLDKRAGDKDMPALVAALTIEWVLHEWLRDERISLALWQALDGRMAAHRDLAISDARKAGIDYLRESPDFDPDDYLKWPLSLVVDTMMRSISAVSIKAGDISITTDDGGQVTLEAKPFV